ncbi:MAG TPA: hypothetical protein VGX69_07060 [Solirubrobacteraceae bacterium]|jgi:hypothetical protein|nr:hypothetical protein [Solirubrobacteraceae bacterium]
MRTALSHSRPLDDRPAGAWLRDRAIGRRVGAVAALVLVLLACLAASAGADVGEQIIERCTHNQSVSGFSQQAYRRALQEMPTEVEEYSDCGNLIRRAELAAAGGRGGSAGTGGSAIATPLSSSERRALRNIPKTGAAPQHVGNELVRPGVIHADIASALSSLPASLLAVLAFLLACALALGARAIGRSFVARRSD